MLAVKTARQAWRAKVGEPTGRPTMVLPITAHSAFIKGARYFDVDLRVLPVDPITCTVRPEDVGAALADLGDRACLVVVSTPSYAHGVMDPVAEVAAIAAPMGVPVHVDACIGGWVLPFMAQLGYDLPDFDLRVPGVRSLSVDLHKYAYAPKGSSLLLFSDADYRMSAFFSYSDWPGYPVVNTTMQSTKSAGPMAAAWAVARRIGADGYRDLVRSARQATEAIVSAVAHIDGLRVVGEPAATLIALAADGPNGVDPFVLADTMKARGWFIQAQPGVGDLPRTAHLTVQATTLANVDEFLDALRAAADDARVLPRAVADEQLMAAAEQIDPAALDLPTLSALLTFAGLDPSGTPSLPDEAAGIQALIEALPTGLRDAMLAGYFSAIFQPNR
ncbi:MAG: sphinganine-phosphate aldolase [Actinomycetota bacterium]|nr:sphinganine-phosphate aldolase [Actinomycetota bacterium]